MKDTNDNGHRRRNPLPPQIRAAIGQKLRETLDPVVSEAVPDRFLRLLESLEQSGSTESDAPALDGAASLAAAITTTPDLGPAPSLGPAGDPASGGTYVDPETRI